MTLDIVLLLVLALCVVFGIKAGFIRSIGGLAGLLLGFYVSSIYYLPVARWLMQVFHIADPLARIVAFVGLFIVVSNAVSMLLWLFKKTFHWIPLGSVVDHAAGGIIGAVEGILILGFALHFALQMPLHTQWKESINSSLVAAPMITTAKALWPIVTRNINEAPMLLK